MARPTAKTLLLFLSLVPALWATPVNDPVLEPATLHSLSVHWIIAGDEGANARIDVHWRGAGTAEWRRAEPLVRVERGAHLGKEHGSDVAVPENAWLFAGSVVNLQPNTAYDLRFSYQEPTGSAREAVLTARTRAEPATAGKHAAKHVIPGNGGGSGTSADPFRGLAAAEATAVPGDLFLLQGGVYTGEFIIRKSGREGSPIIWRGAGDGEVILEGGADAKRRADRVILANDAREVWFEGLTIRSAQYGVVGHEASAIVVRRCHFYDVEYGIAATRNQHGTLNRWFISDNVIEGPATWPRTKGIESARGIQLSGQGHVVCYNRIRGFADGIDTFPSRECAAIDFHNNDISEMTDDGIELDYSQRNVRCFENRLTNVFQGISSQPVFGGPVYVFRNVLFNVVAAPFKLHNSPSGVHLLHNTSVKEGAPLMVATSEPVRHTRSRNNLFVGTVGPYACEMMAPMKACDFDYDGFGGGPWELFLKWNGVRFPTFSEVRANAPAYRHAVLVDASTAFASGVLPPVGPEKVHVAPELQLKAGSAAIDAGEPLPGFNDSFTGTAPDLGAYEIGQPLPHYGPRPEPKR